MQLKLVTFDLQDATAQMPAAKVVERLRQCGSAEAMVLSSAAHVEWVVSSAMPVVWLFPQVGKGRVLEGDDAIRRLCRLACGLESTDLILPQIRDAWAAAQEAGTAGAELQFLMPRLLGLARRVRPRMDDAEAVFANEFAGLLGVIVRRKQHQSIAALELSWNRMRIRELERLRLKMPEVTAEEWTRIEGLAKRLIRKVVHPIISAPVVSELTTSQLLRVR